MIRIDVERAAVNERTATSKQGKPMKFREQEAFAWIPGRDGSTPKYPTRILIGLEDNQAPYAPGSYMPTGESLYVDRFGKLAVGRMVLRQIDPSKLKAA